jgi:hypothetical protein
VGGGEGVELLLKEVLVDIDLSFFTPPVFHFFTFYTFYTFVPKHGQVATIYVPNAV